MQPIRMVDLQGQHRKIKAELNAAIEEVFETTAFVKGPAVAAFERELGEYLGAKHVTACGNGTDALQIALMALDLPQGAEVITPDFTFVATAEVIKLLGFTPVLVDVDPHTFNIDPKSIEAAITENTKVIIPVHLFGQCADMEAIMDIAYRYNIYIVEDTAQAVGAHYLFKDGTKKMAGTIGHIGTTSFYPTKNLGCMGDGGAIFTNDEAIGKKIHCIANHGQKDQYYYERIGVNSRLDTMQAGMLRVKLRNLDQYNEARQKAASLYDKAFSEIEEIETPERFPQSNHIFHQYTIIVKDGRRNEFQAHLNAHKIPNKVYYPVPLHEHEPYAACSRFEAGNLSHSISLSQQVISLPMHTELSMEQIEYIAKTVTEYWVKVS